jgi:hypothetical protein
MSQDATSLKYCPICTHGTLHIFQYHLVALGFKTSQPEPLLLLLYRLLALYIIHLRDSLSEILNLSCARPQLLRHDYQHGQQQQLNKLLLSASLPLDYSHLKPSKASLTQYKTLSICIPFGPFSVI